MNKQERKNRVIAQGEHSNHSHVITGDAEVVRNDNGEITISVGGEGAVLKHILESNWVDSGNEVWTQEHNDIAFPEGEYKFIAQKEFDPYERKIMEVLD